MLYSRVPRSSAWPSIVNVKRSYWLSQRAWASSVSRVWMVNSDESVSKNTRSPTLTTKSWLVPGATAVAPPTLIPRPPGSLPGFLAQADKSITAHSATARPAPRDIDTDFAIQGHSSPTMLGLADL